MMASPTKSIKAMIEVSLIEDILKILGQAIHPNFSHDVVSSVKNSLFLIGKNAIHEHENIEKE